MLGLKQLVSQPIADDKFIALYTKFQYTAPPFPPHCWQAVYGNNNPSLNPMTYEAPLYGNNTTPSYRFSRKSNDRLYAISNHRLYPILVIWNFVSISRHT